MPWNIALQSGRASPNNLFDIFLSLARLFGRWRRQVQRILYCVCPNDRNESSKGDWRRWAVGGTAEKISTKIKASKTITWLASYAICRTGLVCDVFTPNSAAISFFDFLVDADSRWLKLFCGAFVFRITSRRLRGKIEKSLIRRN